MSVLGDLIRQILDDKDLDLEIDPLFVTPDQFSLMRVTVSRYVH